MHIRRVVGRSGVLGLVVGMVVSLMLPFWITDAAAAVTGRTWYVAASGSDAADGRSVSTAWRTLGRVAQQRLIPGDAVLLQGGAIFSGTLRLDATQAGSASSPVRLGSFGAGRASIAPTADAGVVVYNTAGVQVSNLRIVGNANTFHTAAGINAYNDLAGDRKLAYLSVANVEVSGFRVGIGVGGGRGASGFSDVSVINSDLHDNLEAGLIFYGPAFNSATPLYAHQRVRVSGVHAHHNHGDPQELVRNTGSGIVLGSVRDGQVDRSRANDNGGRCSAPEGPVGIWTYDSDLIIIQRSIADHNRSAGPADGDGFDLDQNVSRSVLQGNLSFANDGAGYLVYTGTTNSSHRDNVVRFNVSIGDAVRLPAYGAITVWGRVSQTRIEHNTVIVRSSNGKQPPALSLDAGVTALSVRNNVLVSDGGGPLVRAPALSAAMVVLQGNSYAVSGRSWAVEWAGTNHPTLASWRAATGQETTAGRASGTTFDPLLVNRSVRPVAAATALTPADVVELTGIALTGASQLRRTGVVMPVTPASAVSSSSGMVDVFGNAVDPIRPTSVGAHQPFNP